MHFIFLIFLFFEGGVAAPGAQQALLYLSKYGYMDANSMGNNSFVNAKTFKKSLMDFQDFAGLRVTGKLDKDTLQKMSSPRCGLKDTIGSVGNFEKYVIQGSRWKIRNLKYKVAQYSEKLSRESVDKALRRAFNLWSKYVDLNFQQVENGPANIEIRFASGGHGDSDPFDGPGGTLAHAYFPAYGGTTHFDDAESWTINNPDGKDLFQVAAHEFGHALGLKHTQVKEALMAPYYKGYIPDLDLYRDDIEGIQQLYGGKGGNNPAPKPVQPSHPRNIPSFPSWFPNIPSLPSFPNFPSIPNFPSFPNFPTFRWKITGFPNLFPRYTVLY